MTDVAALRGAEQAQDTCTKLTELLGLGALDLAVKSADVFGRGANASVDLKLSDGAKITFERFGDITKPSVLATQLVTTTGLWRTFKGPQAGEVAALVFQLAKHHGEENADDDVRERGTEYLRLANTISVDLSDQVERFLAFESLANCSPARDAGEDRSAHALASASIALEDLHSGVRLVRSGWFHAYVKRDLGGLFSPERLAILMQRVGWERRNSQGRVKATSPTDARTYSWAFFHVPAEWDDMSRNHRGEVTPGYELEARARACAHTRGAVGTPAVTAYPAEAAA